MEIEVVGASADQTGTYSFGSIEIPPTLPTVTLWHLQELSVGSCKQPR